MEYHVGCAFYVVIGCVVLLERAIRIHVLCNPAYYSLNFLYVVLLCKNVCVCVRERETESEREDTFCITGVSHD